MNARGIPPVAQQVFAVLICSSQGGGYLLWPEEGVPTLAGGRSHLPWPGGRGYLPWPWGTGTYPGQGEGVPILTRLNGYLPWPGGSRYLPWAGYPPCGQKEACENNTFHHPSDACGNEKNVSKIKSSVGMLERHLCLCFCTCSWLTQKAESSIIRHEGVF